MIEKGKISALQMGIMMYPASLAMGILFIPSITSEYAGRDMWISPIWASVLGFLTVFIAFKLNKLYPKETIIQYSRNILGVIPGKVIGVMILLFYLHEISVFTWEYSEFVGSSFLPQTPMVVVMGGMVLACAFVVTGGVEVLGRLAEMTVPIFLFLLLFILILLIPDMEVKHIFPIMEYGIGPSIKGAASLGYLFSDFLLISFFLPFLTNQEKGMKSGMISVFAVMLTIITTNIMIIFVFGNASGSFEAPIMTAVKFISVADFLSHLESIVMAIWIAGTVIQIGVFYYVLALGTAQWLNLIDYRPVVFPLGFLIVLLATWQIPNVPALTRYFQNVAPFLGPLVQTVLPIFLLLVAYIRKREKKEGERKR